MPPSREKSNKDAFRNLAATWWIGDELSYSTTNEQSHIVTEPFTVAFRSSMIKDMLNGLTIRSIKHTLPKAY
jgi:hypothetical protein